MIITDTITISGVSYKHICSDAGYKIEQDQTGVIYDDVIDVLDADYTYTETDDPVEGSEDIYATVGRIVLGEAV